MVDFSNAFVSKIKARLKTHALTAVRNDTGSVRLVSHTSEHFEEALVKGIISDLSCGKLSGSCAVLTNTNEEAFTLCAMLKKTGVAVSLIQSQKSVGVANLAEVRALLKYMTAQMHGQKRASVRLFADAEQWLKASYGASIWLDNVLRLIESFTAVLPAEGFFYLADFEEFLRESVLEDTFERTASSIVVSTIHKAKGREFDHVYILYASRSFEDDDARRKLYVGMTRARFDLTIHYRGALLNQTLPETVHPSVDKTAYNAPDELTAHTHARRRVARLFRRQKAIDSVDARRLSAHTHRRGPHDSHIHRRCASGCLFKSFPSTSGTTQKKRLCGSVRRDRLYRCLAQKPGRSGACRRFADPSPQTRQQRPNGIGFLRFNSQIGRRPQ